MPVLVLLVLMSLNVFALSDEQALEEGMTPIEEMSDFTGEMKFDRSEYVTTIPSEEDIAKVIGSTKQVILVNKASKGPGAQTLRVYRDGVILPLMENNVSKDFVKISTGREKEETAASGRVYLSTTPKGFFRPQRVYTMYYSNTWQADMPNAVFFCPTFSKECGIAIHATTESHYAELGSRASGGCVRTRNEISSQIRELVMDTGLGHEAGRFSTITESHRRWLVTKNSVVVDNLDRYSGIFISKVNSWDTVIVVYE